MNDAPKPERCANVDLDPRYPCQGRPAHPGKHAHETREGVLYTWGVPKKPPERPATEEKCARCGYGIVSHAPAFRNWIGHEFVPPSPPRSANSGSGPTAQASSLATDRANVAPEGVGSRLDGPVSSSPPRSAGRVHTTHFDDCGCLSAKYESQLIAERRSNEILREQNMVLLGTRDDAIARAEQAEKVVEAAKEMMRVTHKGAKYATDPETCSNPVCTALAAYDAERKSTPAQPPAKREER